MLSCSGHQGNSRIIPLDIIAALFIKEQTVHQSADRLKLFLAMAPVFPIFLCFFVLPGQTGSVNTHDNSSFQSDLNLYNTSLEYLAPKLNNNARTFGADENNNTSVSTTESDVNYSVASENTGTVSGSVHIRRDNDELASETVFTSMTVTTVPTSVSSLITTSAVTPTKDCEAMLCEKDAGYFVINPTACAANDSPTISTSIPTTLEILTNANSVSHDILCHWNIRVPDKKIVNVTIDQLVMEEDERNGTQTLDICVENYVNVKRVFNVSVLRNKSVSFTSASSLSFRFRGHDLHLPSAVTFRFLVQPGSGVQDLPVVWLTDTDGYVTSPGFDGMHGLYPPGYDGTFDLHILDYQSVFIKFTHFDLEPGKDDGDCYYDYLDFRVTALNQAWRKCGQQDILSRVYRSSITFSFHTDDLLQFTGFKMMYAILPKSQGPQELSDNLYRCSSTTSLFQFNLVAWWRTCLL